MPVCFFYADTKQWRKLLRRAARIGLVGAEYAYGIDMREAGGAFCVSKPNGRLRLIADKRVRNWKDQLLGKCRLPHGARFSRMLLPKTHALRMSGRDLKDYYFIMGLMSLDGRARAGDLVFQFPGLIIWTTWMPMKPITLRNGGAQI